MLIIFYVTVSNSHNPSNHFTIFLCVYDVILCKIINKINWSWIFCHCRVTPPHTLLTHWPANSNSNSLCFIIKINAVMHDFVSRMVTADKTHCEFIPFFSWILLYVLHICKFFILLVREWHLLCCSWHRSWACATLGSRNARWCL